jgi:protein TonB
MSQYLVSSRVPVYPDAARADHIQGRVLLQAVINENGFVGHLHVLDGDPALRRAALDAVSTWHYRPYLVDGTPVAVTTTIPVDFSGLN